MWGCAGRAFFTSDTCINCAYLSTHSALANSDIKGSSIGPTVARRPTQKRRGCATWRSLVFFVAAPRRGLMVIQSFAGISILHQDLGGLVADFHQEHAAAGGHHDREHQRHSARIAHKSAYQPRRQHHHQKQPRRAPLP